MNINSVLDELNFDKKLKSVTYVESKKKVITLTRRFKYDARKNRNEYVLTIGAPNYLARAKIKRMGNKIGYYILKSYPKKKVDK